MELINVYKMANSLYREFGLYGRWSFKLDKAVRRFGVCIPSKRAISLSRVLCELNERPIVEDTLRHEIAHALDYEDRGTSDHSYKWKKWAIHCGAKPERCYGEEVAQPEKPYCLYCPTCGARIGRMRKVKVDGKLKSCVKCSRTFNKRYLLIPNMTPALVEKITKGQLSVHDTDQAKAVKRVLHARYGKQAVENLAWGKHD